MHRYEKKNNYIFDVHDERELARLQLLDNLFNEALDMLPKQFIHDRSYARILDVACGPGGWVLQIAQAHAEWSVMGVDISPKMIEYARAQAEAQELDVQFRFMDVLKIPWSFPDQYFDLVNVRFITGFAPVTSLPSFYQECWRVLRLGGIMRSTEIVCMSTPRSPAITQLSRMTFAAMWKAGLIFSPDDMSVNAVLASMLKHIGFENITLLPSVIDLSYGAPMHQPMGETLKISADLLKPLLIRTGLISSEDLDKLHDDWTHEWKDKHFCCHYHVCSISGKKPFQVQLEGYTVVHK